MPFDLNQQSAFATDLTKTTQGRLAHLGYYSGRIDGKALAATENAMIDFKTQHGLRARPYPGPITLTALWSHDAKRAPRPIKRDGEPLWLGEARRLLGTKEVPGARSNPVIMSWAEDLDQWYPGDDVHWCGLFVARCMSVGAPDQPQDFNRLGARAWMNFGVECDEWLGAVAVFWRTHPTRSWNGHVAIVTGSSATAVRVIGGNQSDNVTETWISRERLLGFRGPDGWSGNPAPRAKTGAFSTNEA